MPGRGGAALNWCTACHCCFKPLDESAVRWGNKCSWCSAVHRIDRQGPAMQAQAFGKKSSSRTPRLSSSSSALSTQMCGFLLHAAARSAAREDNKRSCCDETRHVDRQGPAIQAQTVQQQDTLAVVQRRPSAARAPAAAGAEGRSKSTMVRGNIRIWRSIQHSHSPS